MFVSDIRHRDQGGGDRDRALTWLQGQLVWEATLNRLRRLAGTLPPPAPAAAVGSKSAA